MHINDQVLLNFIRRYHLRGHFNLSCGKVADDYLDLAPVMLFPSSLSYIVNAVRRILNRTDWMYNKIACVETCPIPLVTALSREEDCSGLVVRKRLKGHGTNRWIEGYSGGFGNRVVVVEDVTSTGASVMHAVNTLRSHGCYVVGVIAVVNRYEGCNELLEANDVPFEWVFSIDEVLCNDAED